MLANYARSSDPCERAADALLDSARAHGGWSLKLRMAKSRAMRRALATAVGAAAALAGVVIGVAIARVSRG